MKCRKKIIIILILSIGILISILTYFFIINKQDDSYLYVNIERNNNVTNPEDYKGIIDKAKSDYGNDDVVGIFEILNTDFIVPIMQSDDNDYYLNHDAYGKENFMGAIFLDYRNDINLDKKLLIFGHNSANVVMPFDILENYYEEDYYREHKYIEITTDLFKKKYEIFSVYVEVQDFSYMRIIYNSDDEYWEHLQTLKERSMYETDASISRDDEIVILQTCSEHPDYRNYEDKYLLIALKKI